MKKKAGYILFSFCLLMITSCAKEVSQEDLIKTAVQMKIEQWRYSQVTECKEKIYIKAEDYVDSLLVATSLDSKLDTIPKPSKPGKPPKPAFKVKPDSVIVDPIYDQGK